MTCLYTKRGTASLKEEVNVNVAVIPDSFFEFLDEDITAEYPQNPVSPIAGNRSLDLDTVDGMIPPAEGSINLNVEPAMLGHFLNGLFGGLTSGRYVAFTSLVGGPFTVGETVTGGTSTETATVLYVGVDYLLLGTPSGDFTDGETITGGSSSATASITEYDTAVYGHSADVPAEIGNSYSLQINYEDSAIRYMGVRFRALDSLGQNDNVVTAGITAMCQSMFRNTKVGAIATAGSSVAVEVDQTLGLVATDVVKVWRPSTGAFLDLGGVGTKTTTVASVTDADTVVLTTITDNLAVGDLLMLAPQTATYAVEDEFKWVGGAEVSVGALIGSVVSEKVEEFELIIDHEFESRHAAQGSDFADKYAAELCQKGIRVTGTFMVRYEDEEFFGYLRDGTARALVYKVQGENAGTGSIPFEMRYEIPKMVLNSFDSNLSNDDLVDTEIPFTAVYDSVEGTLATVLLVNETASY